MRKRFFPIFKKIIKAIRFAAKDFNEMTIQRINFVENCKEIFTSIDVHAP